MLRLSIAIVVVLGAAALPVQAAGCLLDAECDDGVECNGLETCDPAGNCRAGIGLCGPLREIVGRRISASSFYSAAYHPTLAFDGINTINSSWCSLRTDPEPELAIDLPVDVRIDRIDVVNSWLSNSVLLGTLLLSDRAGTVLFDSGPVAFSGGALVLPISPPVAGVRSLRIVPNTWAGREPCIGDIEILGGLPCATDLDCEFVSPCLAGGACQASGTCTATAGNCRNLAPGVSAYAASSEYSLSYVAHNAIDQIDDFSHSWCATDADPEPNLWLRLPNPRAVSMMNIRNPWVSSAIDRAQITLRDELDLPRFEQADVAFDNGQLQLIFDPPVSEALTADIRATEFDQGPCISELELLAEYCEISITGGEPLAVRFHPGTPSPNFELRFGKLTELRADGGFLRSTCGPQATEATLELSLPTPSPGDGYYMIARGLNVCEEDGYGLSWAQPDPRAQLAAFPACVP